MKVPGSSVVAYYVGNAALALDRQAGQQSQRAAQQLQSAPRPQPLSEQVLEGELLNEQRQRQEAQSQQSTVDESVLRQQSAAPTAVNPLSNNPAIRHYQSTALLDGFAKAGPPHLVDIYI